MYPSASALPPAVQSLRTAIAPFYRADEATVIAERTEQAKLDPILSERVRTRATQLIAGMRLKMENGGRIEQFLQEYQLSTREGVTLMCLAEALLRIPDTETADALIRDKLGGADWEAHLGKSDSVLVNASTWALMLTGRVVNLDKPVVQKSGLVSDLLGKLVARSGEPVIRAAIRTAMKILGKQFVMGRTIDEAWTARFRRRRKATAIPTICSANRPARAPMRSAILRLMTAPFAPSAQRWRGGR
ncbi:hypothetical protein [Elstera litoralis]|uniref:hypothetical protein n=1 Tax=Elstera litoralis TaxID=552518 RepID=UPI000AA25158|nr:hypothetical protein [Elstera litoralis]